MLSESMTIAAESLRITQPAVSRLIKELEGQLQFKLFKRVGNRLTPTHEGTILFAEVDRLYVGIDSIAKIATDLRHTKAGSLRIASMSSLAMSCVPEAINLFHADRPAVNLMLSSSNSVRTLELLAGRQYDIGFVHYAGEFPGVDLRPLPSIEVVCIIPASYEIASKKIITPEDLRDLPFISQGRNLPLRRKIDQIFSKLKIPRKTVFEIDLAASVISLVSAGLGISLIDPFSARTFENRKYVIRPFSPKLNFDVLAATPSHYPNSKLCDEFTNILEELVKNMQNSPVYN